jgi:hypothetical protein
MDVVGEGFDGYKHLVDYEEDPTERQAIWSVPVGHIFAPALDPLSFDVDDLSDVSDFSYGSQARDLVCGAALIPQSPHTGGPSLGSQEDLGEKPIVKKGKFQAGIKLVPHPHKLALGDDIMLPEVPDLAERVVVGKENGQHLGTTQLRVMGPK